MPETQGAAALWTQLQSLPVPPWAAGYPLAFWGAVLAVLLLALGSGLAVWLRARRFTQRLRGALANPALAGALLRDRYSAAELLGRSRLIERVAQQEGEQVVRLSGVDDLWIGRLRLRPRRRDMARVLRYAPDKGLFVAFQAALRSPRLGETLTAWLAKQESLPQLRRLAQSSAGAAFDGAAGHGLLRGRIDEVLELCGDPEWHSRYFAVQILLHDAQPRTQQALWDALDDPHPLVRKTVLAAFQAGERDELYTRLYDFYVHDPAYEVRQAAWTRLHAEFGERFALNPADLEGDEALHVLEQLREDDKGDENVALRFLASENLEYRLLAAEFLQRCGGLQRLCTGTDLGDREGMERVYGLLRAAAEVNITDYLHACVQQTDNTAALLLCARLLEQESPLPEVIQTLASKVFARYDGSVAAQELYRQTLACIARHGSPAVEAQYAQELSRRRADPTAMGLLLEALPEQPPAVLLSPLVAMFRNPEDPYRPQVREAIKRVPTAQVVPWMLGLIRSPREAVPIPVRIDAVRILGELGLSYCLQTVLENIWMLPPADAREFMGVLADYPRELLVEKVQRLLATRDSRLRASIAAALPVTGERRFVETLRGMLGDVDPEVRIAAVWALSEYPGVDWRDEELAVLHDPSERVRSEAARALASVGSDAVVALLKARLEERDEAETVQHAAIEGLGHVRQTAAIDILAAHLDREPLQEAILTALARRTHADDLAHLFEHFKDADPRRRELLTRAFSHMGEPGAQAMAGLLREDIPSLRPFILQVLEETGHIDYQIRLLPHPDPAVRRQVADFLTTVGSLPALRGLVLAAKDPDEQVRIKVVRALEFLSSEPSRQILDSLRQDPSRKVRRYTRWALERVRAKGMGEG